MLIEFRTPGEKQTPTTYLTECITALTSYLVHDVPGRDLVGLRICNTENVQDRVAGISLRRRDQFKPDIVWGLRMKSTHRNARFGLADRLEVHLDHVGMPAGNGRVKTKGRSLDMMSTIKKSIVSVKAAINCLAYVLIIAMARLNGDPKHQSYRDRYGLKKPVDDLLKASCVDLPNGEGFRERFQNHISDYKMIVFDGLNPDRVMFCGNSLSAKKLYLLYDRDLEHYSVITNLKGVWRKSTYVTDVTLSMTKRTNVIKYVLKMRQNIVTCNRRFLSEKCFQNHLTLKVKGKLVCQWRQVCQKCSCLVTSDSKHECFKKFCN